MATDKGGSQDQDKREAERQRLNDQALRGDDQPGPGGVPEALSATLPGTELTFAAMLHKLTLAQASNGLNYTVELEAPLGFTQAIANMRDALTVYWLGDNDEAGRLIAMGGSLVSATVKRDADDAARLVVKYKFSQDQVLIGVGIVAAALAMDETKGRITLRSDQLTFDLAARG